MVRPHQRTQPRRVNERHGRHVENKQSDVMGLERCDSEIAKPLRVAEIDLTCQR